MLTSMLVLTCLMSPHVQPVPQPALIPVGVQIDEQPLFVGVPAGWLCVVTPDNDLRLSIPPSIVGDRRRPRRWR